MYESLSKTLPVGRVGETCKIARDYLLLMQERYSTATPSW